MSQTFCTACGAALPPAALFCGACGTRVDADPPNQPEPAAPEIEEVPAEAPPPPPPAPPIPDLPPPPPAPEAVAPPTPAPAPETYAPPPAPPAPAYAAPPAAPISAPAAPLDAESEPLLRAYVGPNADHYLGKWAEIGAAGKPNSWNWAAFFLNAFWLAYRRMWGAALATLAAIVVLQLIGMFQPGLRALAGGLALGVCALVGWRGNAMYRAQAERAVAQSAAMAQDRGGRAAWLQGQGGTSMPGALGLVAGILVLWFLFFFVVAKEMGLGSSRSSSYGSPYGSSTGTGSSEWFEPSFLQNYQWSTDCHGNGTYISFNPDGTFAASVGSGNWLLIADLLTLTYSNGQPAEQMVVRRTSPNQFSFVEGNRTGVFNRC